MKRIAIITGASSGLGRAFAVKMPRVRALDEVYLVARRKSELEKTASLMQCGTRILTFDITREEDINQLSDILSKEKPDVECLVNAAGYGKIGSIAEETLENVSGMVRLNAQALVVITSVVLPYMSKGSWIINVSSVAAFQPIPYLGIYAASKAFVASYSKTLHFELKKQKINVTCVCPYWIKDTEFIGIATQKHYSYFGNKPLQTTTEKVVCSSVKAVKRNKTICTPDMMSSLERILSFFIPDFIMIRIMNVMSKL